MCVIRYIYIPAPYHCLSANWSREDVFQLEDNRDGLVIDQPELQVAAEAERLGSRWWRWAEEITTPAHMKGSKTEKKTKKQTWVITLNHWIKWQAAASLNAARLIKGINHCVEGLTLVCSACAGKEAGERAGGVCHLQFAYSIDESEWWGGVKSTFGDLIISLFVLFFLLITL